MGQSCEKTSAVAPYSLVGVDVADAHHQVALVGAFDPELIQKTAHTQSGGVETQDHWIFRLGDFALDCAGVYPAPFDAVACQNVQYLPTLRRSGVAVVE